MICANTQRCNRCLERKPLAEAYFRRAGHDGAKFESICKPCRRAYERERNARHRQPVRFRSLRAIATDSKHVPGKICSECCSMPWRIVGPKCIGCGELYAKEPAQELRDFTYRYFERVTA